MKRLILALFLLAVAWIGCTTSQQTVAYKTIGASEAAVLAANSAYLDAVVTGVVPTNSVPQVERDFNDVQMALHLAAVTASGGANAPIPIAVNVKVMNFTNAVNVPKLR